MDTNSVELNYLFNKEMLIDDLIDKLIERKLIGYNSILLEKNEKVLTIKVTKEIPSPYFDCNKKENKYIISERDTNTTIPDVPKEQRSQIY